MTTSETPEPTRRDFIHIATGAVGAVGVAAAAWPFIHQMNPDASVQALAAIDVNLDAIEEGQSVTVMWRGKPIFIRHRTAGEIEEARDVSLDDLPDPFAQILGGDESLSAADENRAERPEWLVMVGICTHLGCVPLGEQGEYNGWFCPCHGSHYDTSGRIRRGPAPRNLDIPPYEFTSDTAIRIG